MLNWHVGFLFRRIFLMAWSNQQHGYGGLTKWFHWLTVGLFAFQYLVGHLMVRTGGGDTALGMGPAALYNWHKSIGLIALVVVLGRVWARRQGQLPDWAPSLTVTEHRFIHRGEQVLYSAMFVMPLSGFVHVMAGGYGVLLFGLFALPNPLGSWPTLAGLAQWTHIGAGWVLAATLAGHVGLVLRHQLVLKDGLLLRMLPQRRRDR
jgi:cytochrome b561